MSESKDHFSKVAEKYVKFRPVYPSQMYQFIAEQCGRHDRAWDCGTGNGQAAIGLAQYFKQIVATDLSQSQIDKAHAHPQVTYNVSTAEESNLETDTYDLITVAQALHWFKHERFFEEAKRILKPGGVLAPWTYSLFRIGEGIDEIIDRYYYEIIGSYWPAERKHVDSEYQSISLPFDKVERHSYEINENWSAEHVLGYLRSWSSTQRYLDTNNEDPVSLIKDEFMKAWGDPDSLRKATWPLHLYIIHN